MADPGRGAALRSTELQIIDLTTLKPRPLPAITKGVVSQIRWRPGSRELGFSLASVKAQGVAYSIGTSLGTLTRWTASEATFNADVLPVPEVLEWKSEDGQTISGILYRPAAKFAGPRPVMIQIHGGPAWQRMNTWYPEIQWLLARGCAVLCLPSANEGLGLVIVDYLQLMSGPENAGSREQEVSKASPTPVIFRNSRLETIFASQRIRNSAE